MNKIKFLLTMMIDWDHKLNSKVFTEVTYRLLTAFLPDNVEPFSVVLCRSACTVLPFKSRETWYCTEVTESQLLLFMRHHSISFGEFCNIYGKIRHQYIMIKYTGILIHLPHLFLLLQLFTAGHRFTMKTSTKYL